ncbi:hypothetical protein D3C80_2146690 [compost metagenome]
MILHRIEAPGVFGQAKVGQVCVGEAALEGDVVHGGDAGGAALVVEVGRGQGSLPVVAVHHIGLPADG